MQLSIETFFNIAAYLKVDVRELFISFDRLKKWTNNNSFPFTYSQFSDTSVVEVGFPIWIEEDVVLYRFSTGLVAVEQGNSMETEKNGYIVFNSDGSRVAVYH